MIVQNNPGKLIDIKNIQNQHQTVKSADSHAVASLTLAPAEYEVYTTLSEDNASASNPFNNRFFSKTADSQVHPENKKQPGNTKQTPEMPKKKWTILFYGAGDNDLEKHIVQNISDLETNSDSAHVNYIVQLDRGNQSASQNGAWAGCRRFKLERDNDPTKINAPQIKDLGQINMADPKNLQNFIEWGVENYPAQHYFLVVMDHGGGWLGAIKDDSHQGWMTMPDMKKAISQAESNSKMKFDIIGFDACLMAQAEVAYQLKDLTDYIIASEDEEGKGGWPYKSIFSRNSINVLQQALQHRFNIAPKGLADLIVKAAAKGQTTTPTMSVIDTSNMGILAYATRELADAILNSTVATSAYKTIIRKTQPFGGFKDFYDFCQRLAEDESINDQRVKQAALDTMNTILFVIPNQHSSDRYSSAHGLSIHLPSFKNNFREKYKEIDFAKITGWDKVVEKLTEPEKIS
jgi:hypothetical protein